MFFEGCYLGIVIRREVYLRPFGDVLHQNTFLAQFGNHAVEVEVFAIVSTTLNAEQFFKLSVKAGKIFREVLLECLVVVADVRERLSLTYDIVVVAALAVTKSLYKVVYIFDRVYPLVFLNIAHLVTHTPFKHYQSEEGHHIVRKFTLLNSRRNKQVGTRPNIRFV